MHLLLEFTYNNKNSKPEKNKIFSGFVSNKNDEYEIASSPSDNFEKISFTSIAFTLYHHMGKNNFKGSPVQALKPKLW